MGATCISKFRRYGCNPFRTRDTGEGGTIASKRLHGNSDIQWSRHMYWLVTMSVAVTVLMTLLLQAASHGKKQGIPASLLHEISFCS